MRYVLPHSRRALAAGAASAALLALAGASAASAAPAHHAAGKAEKIPFRSASITHESGTAYKVAWNGPGAGRVEVLRASGHGRALATGGAHGSVTVKASGAHPSFTLVPANGAPLTLAARSLGLPDDPNFRDVGGYRTSDGQWVRTGVVYRSAALTLRAADLKTVGTLGITTDYDLRTPAEEAATPDVIPAGAQRVALNVTGTQSTGSPSLTSVQQSLDLMENGERQMVLSKSGRASYRALLLGIANRPGAKVMHCSAGKDRTGWGTAVLLSVLGVPRATVVNDYLLSNTYLGPSISAELAAMPAAAQAIYKPLLGVQKSFLEAGFDQVAKTYGTIDNYVEHGLGIGPKTIAKLKAELLVG